MHPKIVDSIVKLLKIYYNNFILVFFSKNDEYFKYVKHMKFVKGEVQKY